MGKPYHTEIDNIPKIPSWVQKIRIDSLSKLLERWADAPLIFVGSGGSYTAAKSLAFFHEEKYGHPGIALTPLFLSRALKSMRGVRVVLLSAEGKNKDILAAAECARALDVPCAAITLSSSSPLVDYANRWRSVFIFSYEVPWGKDGYLATNSLICTVLIGLMGYFGDRYVNSIEGILSEGEVERKRKEIKKIKSLEHVRNRGVLVLHGPDTEVLAVDLESKISEAALGMCQVADYRQFAHGRHLQYAGDPSNSPVLMSVFSSKESVLAFKSTVGLPEGETNAKLMISGEDVPLVHLSSIVSSILLTAEIAAHDGIDPGEPHVPRFGRELYSLDVGDLIGRPEVPSVEDIGAIRKSRVVFPSSCGESRLKPAATEYIANLSSYVFKAVVFDYDGTLCNVHERYEDLGVESAEIILSAIDSGLVVGVATGRGRSVIENLRKIIPSSYWDRIFVGLHSGSQVKSLNDEYVFLPENPHHINAVEYLKRSCIGEFISERCVFKREGQLGIRLSNKSLSDVTISLLKEWMSVYGKTGWRVFYSGHSIDVLDENTSKRNVVDHICAKMGWDPYKEVLRIGDAGQESGNDWELLSEGVGLSVEGVSRSVKSCWNFSPSGVRQLNATKFYMDSLVKVDGGVLVDFNKGVLCWKDSRGRL